MSRTDVRGDSCRGHFFLPFECGLCAQPIKQHSIAYALVSTPDSMNLDEVTRPFVFPHGATGSGRNPPGSPEPFARVGDWAVGARFNVEPPPPGNRVECSAIHDVCFQVYTTCAGHSQDALLYLWFFSLWRQPWDRAKTMQGLRPLPRESSLSSKPAICHVLAKVGMLDIATHLPWEIVSNIFDFSGGSPLWRVAQAATVAFECRECNVDDCASIPALDILSWKRGDKSPESVDPPPETNMLTRFTIDSQGISRIERIERSSAVRPSEQAYTHEYIAAEAEELQSVQVIFKHGRARLHIPAGHPGFTTWDMPCPPPGPLHYAGLSDGLSDWVSHGASLARICGLPAPANRFQTAHLEGATGITFIFHSNFLAHIHAHSPEYPVAQFPHDTEVMEEIGGAPMEEFPNLASVHLPLPPGDKILSISFGTDGRVQRIRQPGMLVHTKLAGTVFIGYLMPINRPCIQLGQEPELLFTRLQAPFVSGVGAYSSNPVSQLQFSDKVGRFPREMAFGHPELFRLTSYAPLDDVVRLDVAEEPTSGALRGLMFYYANGAQRSVGQYRIGFHLIRTYAEPKYLCLTGSYRTQVATAVPQPIYATANCSCEEGHGTHSTRSRRQWRTCYLLTGYVQAQFDVDWISPQFADREFRVIDAMGRPVPRPVSPGLHPF